MSTVYESVGVWSKASTTTLRVGRGGTLSRFDRDWGNSLKGGYASRATGIVVEDLNTAANQWRAERRFTPLPGLRSLLDSPWGFPWDLGVAGFIFGNGEMPGARISLTTWTGPVPPDPGPRPQQDPQHEQEVRVLPGGGAASADWNPKIAGIQRLVSSWPEQQAEERDSTVQVWRTIVERTRPTSSKLASQLHGCHDPGSALIIVQNTFRGKATATLMKRGCSVTACLRWSDLEGVEPFPFKETLVYRYVEQLRSDGAPATKASSFLEAVQFTHVLLGMEGSPLDVIQSARVQGAALASFDSQRISVKAPPFTIHAVRLLEEGVTELSARVQRIVAGDACFLIHGRLRCDDAARVTLEPTLDLDDNGKGYVENTPIGGDAKTGASRRKRRLGLPSVADASGLSGSWAEGWLSLRREEGLGAAKDGALFLAVNGAGLFAKARRSASSMTKLVREILVSAVVPLDECRYTSHSGKAIRLSGAAKFGLNHGFRLLLGGHAKPKDLSVLEYHETAWAPP